MLKIPKLSNPLVKDIRTGEGVLEWLLAAGNAAAMLCGDLSFAKGGLYMGIIAGMKGARRLLLKAVAVQKGLGVGDPIPFTPSIQTSSGTAFTFTPTTAGNVAHQVASDIDKGASAGTVEGQVISDITDAQEMATTPPPDPEAQPTAAPAAEPAPAPAAPAATPAAPAA